MAMSEQVMWANSVSAIARLRIAHPVQIATKRLIPQWRKVQEALVAEFDIKETNACKISERLLELADLRNLLVHGFYDYCTKTKEKTVMSYRWDQGLETYWEERSIIDIASLYRLRDEIDEIFTKLTDCDEMQMVAVRAAASTNPRVEKPTRPEILSRAPTPLPI